MQSSNEVLHDVDVNRPGTLAAVVILGSVAISILLLAPALVGQMITELAFSPQQGGYIISADMAGLAMATFPALWWLKRLSWQKVAFFSLIASIFFLLLSMFATDFSSLLLVRFLGGLSSGSVISVALATTGLIRNPERVFGLCVAGQLLLGAAGLALMPYMLPITGIKGIYLILSGLTLLCLLLVRYIPFSAQSKNIVAHATRTDTWNVKAIVLVGIAILGLYLFYVSLNGVWTYLERIGVAAGLEPKKIGQYLAIASAMGVVGAVLAALLNTRLGKILPVGTGIAMILCALLLLREHTTFMAYFIAACLFKFAWTFVLPYFLGSIAGNDISGRSIVIANIFVGAGLASGPAIAALLISQSSYDLVLRAAFGGMTLCFFLFLPLLLNRSKSTATNDVLLTT